MDGGNLFRGEFNKPEVITMIVLFYRVDISMFTGFALKYGAENVKAETMPNSGKGFAKGCFEVG